MTVATVEYPGYGVNSTPLTHDALFETCECFVDYFHTGPYENVPIFLYMNVYFMSLDMVIH